MSRFVINIQVLIAKFTRCANLKCKDKERCYNKARAVLVLVNVDGAYNIDLGKHAPGAVILNVKQNFLASSSNNDDHEWHVQPTGCEENCDPV